MILPTMNDDDKAYEAVRVTNWLCDIIKKYHRDVTDRFRRGTHFPYFQRVKAVDDKGNEWVILFFILNKAQRRKKIFATLAYITYNIPRKRKENDVNAGRGCLLMDPISMKSMLDKTGSKMAAVMDITPHAFNRYTERYLVGKNLGGIEFGRKVENLLSRWQWFDVEADLCGDTNAQKNMDGNICPYDVFMRGGGMLRGQIVNPVFIRFNTYVSEDMMFDNQYERQVAMQREYFRNKREGIIK